ncbi:inner membrane protein YpjD [Nitrosomonas communis]|uniref:cytochrome C assembly family protein n=1 Tax=Nitrosomonas communis TaxID=44574 RepID=UPI0026EDA2EF|nr:cytochrome c biogenesis protein CcsA [Nitrosomonas communis]MCO6426605.1 cytochrome c biogenesis protein CcsA [Nitrosomonas communis]
MLSILVYIAAFLFYASVGWYFWRTRWKNQPIFPSADVSASVIANWERFGMLAPVTLHALILYQSIFINEGLSFGVGNAISSIVWLTALIYWFSGFFPRLQELQNLIAPIAIVAAVAVLLPLALPSLHPLANTELPAFKAHLLVAMLAYSLFTIAALHAVLMTILEYRLHHPAMSPLLMNLPPLLVMEKMLFRIIWTGFILLTLTLFSGIIFSQEVFGQSVTFSHKTLFSFISWGVFAALLIGRQFYGWRGRTAIRWTLTGFAILLLAYIGSKFVLEIILDR